MSNKELLRKLVKNSPVVNKTHLKKQLIKYGYLENKCDWCGMGAEWRGKPISLEMDHINGNNTDNRLDNLRILCLNCHSQTPTFRRAKKKPQRKKDHSIKVYRTVFYSGVLWGVGAAIVVTNIF